MYAERINSLPPYLFADIDRKKREAENRGVDIIDMGVGDPDLPTPSHIVDALCKAAAEPANHRYPSYEGMFTFREAVADWYRRRKHVSLDPDSEVLTLIGSKEGIAHSTFAFLNPHDIALVPNPAYPVYKNAVIMADSIPFSMPLMEESGFKPDFERIDAEIAKSAKLMFLNYPNNPTAATADEEFFKEVVDFAYEHDIMVLHDNPYSELTFDGYEAPSFLRVNGAKEVGIEFNSLSKTYNMTGWRIGFAVGNHEILNGLRLVKTNIDSGTFQAIQIAGIAALTGSQDCIRANVAVYRARRDALVAGLKSAGIEASKPKATFYLWVRVPDGYSSMQFSMFLLERAGVVVTPGVGFGEYGEGFVRFSLCLDIERIKEACERITDIL
ncbi:MAG: LL-diaminopimelate aminotransferase [Methanophagales archaeon]|nr:LL-diaminopimelate aminotransferase [Methanophagales archaeon]MCW3139643.1 LL-diaminopimelate aminotransferase [Methanophagales archaeon]MCW7069491.1 LL-diaminopimelate aminotransferase [Methanophagales archaeon]MCW7072846.1 LL-diaminopimelate aminotransferase [Methanophagales archaeon]